MQIKSSFEHHSPIVCTTVLHGLEQGRVFSIIPRNDGTFGVFEECDQHFGVELTREQLLLLAKEIEEVATT